MGQMHYMFYEIEACWSVSALGSYCIIPNLRCLFSIGIGTGPVLAGPLATFKVKTKFHFAIAITKRSASVIFRLIVSPYNK